MAFKIRMTGIDGIVKIGLLHCAVAVINIVRILLLHIRLFLQTVNGTDVVQRLWNVTRSTADCTAVGNLGGQHVFLNITGKEEQNRE